MLKTDAPFDEYHDLLIQMKAAGITAEDALSLFEGIRNEMRSEGNEKGEDRIMEVMDIVVGYCSPHLRVW